MAIEYGTGGRLVLVRRRVAVCTLIVDLPRYWLARERDLVFHPFRVSDAHRVR